MTNERDAREVTVVVTAFDEWWSREAGHIPNDLCATANTKHWLRKAWDAARALEPAPSGEWTREPVSEHPVADLWYWMRNIDSPHERWVGRGINTYDHPYGWERWSLPIALPPAPTDEVK